MAASADVRIHRLIHPCQFRADSVDAGFTARHDLMEFRIEKSLRLNGPVIESLP